MDYLIVAAIGIFSGGVELATRYRDNPWRAVWSLPGSLYLAINIGAAVMALFFITDVFDWKFGFEDNPVALRWIRVVLAGTGAMAFFRSSLFTIRVGDKDVPLGLGLILQVLLDVTDRAVDRGRAKPRALLVGKIMDKVLFKKALVALPAYCFALMQNVSAEEQATFGRQIAQLSTADMTDEVKTLTLGLALMNVVGDAVLTAAVQSLGPQIK